MPDRRVVIGLGEQRLHLLDDGRVVRSYAVSTSVRGAGERYGSFCTPRGEHVIRAKIGAGQPPGAVFVGRRPTGEICTPEAHRSAPARDWILSRILWLCGLERGRNRFGDVDTMRRFIYIHGCPDWSPMGVRGSRGCIRMRNDDVMELFDAVPVGTRVSIDE
jgi:lipoprotein-anchoring transpeptidase ErfK/SrfK